MKRKNFVSLMMSFAFLAISSTGLLMYFDFKPGPVKGIHVLFGLILIGFAIFHIMNNWGPLKSYMREKNGRPIRKELIIGSLVAGIVLLGAGFSIPPFPQIQRFGEELSRDGEKGRRAGRLMFETISVDGVKGGRSLSLIIQKGKDVTLPSMVIWTEDSDHHFLQNIFVPAKVASLPEGESDVREAIEEGELTLGDLNPGSFPAWKAATSDKKSNHPGTTPFENFVLNTHIGKATSAFLYLEIVAGGQHALYQTNMDTVAGKAFSLSTQDQALLERAIGDIR